MKKAFNELFRDTGIWHWTNPLYILYISLLISSTPLIILAGLSMRFFYEIRDAYFDNYQVYQKDTPFLEKFISNYLTYTRNCPNPKHPHYNTYLTVKEILNDRKQAQNL